MAVIAAMPEMPEMTNDAALAKARDASKWLRKTKICVYYIQGDCKLGSKCNFAHSSEEVQDTPNLHKTQLCKEFEKGNCNNVDCSFAHGVEELRISPSYKKKLCKWFDKAKCRNGAECGFAHGQEELRAVEPAPQVTTPSIPPPPGIAPPPGLCLQEPADAGSKVSLALEGRLLDTKVEAPLKDQVNELSSVISMLQTTVDDMMVRKQISEMKQVVSQLSQQCAALSSIAEGDLQQPIAAMETSVPAPIAYTPLKSLKTKLKSSAAPFVPLNAHAAPFVPMPESSSSDESNFQSELTSSPESSPVIGIPMNSKAKPFVPCTESGDDSTSVGTDGFNSE